MARMASAFQHAIAALSIGTSFYLPQIPKHVWVARANAFMLERHKLRSLMPPECERLPLTKIPALSGKTPIPTSPSSSKPRRSTRSCSEISRRTFRLRRQQRHSLMDRLQIFRQQVRVPAGHFQRAMPEYLLQVKHRAAFSQIVKRECVTHRVQGSSWRFETKRSTVEFGRS